MTCKNYTKGFPYFFVKGHRVCPKPILTDEPRFYDSLGIACRFIPLTRGQNATVWEIHYEWLMQWFWQAWMSSSGDYYAIRSKRIGRERVTVRMHRLILDMDDNDPRKGDHENGITLDNRLINLRPADDTQNCINTKIYASNTTGRKGVSFIKKRQKYRAELWIRGVRYYLGDHDTFEEACSVREAAEKKYHGEFARSQ